ncbi:uncharacterized protein LOC132544835 [Ylistrum balloti]|uniref:uncharacterized protein LOC132544835 n=1 Tax=Ylistrum balloti TaxID=509963 RepID=UPI0029059ACA|nr:uncharacterized protein LOC132544835 [Ylistrum balloti]
MATKDEEDSLVLNTTMDSVAASKITRIMQEQLFDLFPIVFHVATIISKIRGWVKEVKVLGSVGEGLVYFGLFTGTESDGDFMMVSENSLAYEHCCVQVPLSYWLFQIQPCTSNSGYVRLRLKRKGNVRLFNTTLFDTASLFEYDKQSDSSYLTNELTSHATPLVQNMCFALPSIKVRDSYTKIVNSGPCITLSNASVCPKMGPKDDLDMVIGIECPEWPSVAMEWISRERFSGYPSREFIDQQVSRGCYLIPVGCKECKQTHLDWRISFAHIEQSIVHNMNETQLNCLLLLRQLKKFLFEVKIPKVITSYIIKTTVFWTIEESSPDLWQRRRLLTAVKVCLNKLITFIQNGFCPHYFIRTCNLLIRRCSPSNKSMVLQTCLEARRNPMKILCQTPPFVQEIPLQRSQHQLSSEYSEQWVFDVIEEFFATACPSLMTQFIINHICLCLQLQLSQKDSTEEVQLYCMTLIEEINDFCSSYTGKCKQEVGIIQKQIHQFVKRLLMTGKLDARSLPNDVNEEDVNDIANICHLLVVTENYSRCHDILSRFLNAQKHTLYKRLIHQGLIATGSDFNTKKAMFNALLLLTSDKTLNITDLIILQIEENTVPIPLQIELNPIPIGRPEVDTLPGNRPTILVDPLVYLCFLKFWCSMKMDQNIEKLRARDDMVWCCGLINISEKSVAFNLLAFCHIQLQEYEEAFAVLCRAYREKPVNCSTLIHIANLVNNKLHM